MGAPEWMCVSLVEFSDGGGPIAMLLQRGSREECELVADRIPAVSYSGERPVSKAWLCVCPADGGDLA
uniref:Uncharacterized protein n=1 Tax=viral metagenome TaxID=1070528 RepID=A0A6M3LFW0_9ZZZZ